MKFLTYVFSVSSAHALTVNLPKPRIVDPQCNPVRDPTIAGFNRTITPTFRADIDSCVYSPGGGSTTCASGYSYDSSLKLCKKTPPDCPSDGIFIYNPSTKKCEEKVGAPVFEEYKDLNICKERCYDLRIDAKIEGLSGNPTNSTGGAIRECTIPSTTITRAQFAYILVTALFGDNFSYTTTPYYEDVPPTHPYFKYIQKARDANLMLGVQIDGKSYFWPDVTSPESYIFRGSVYIVVWRYRNKKIVPDPGTYSMIPYFPDVTPSTAPEYFPYVQSAYEQGLVVSVSAGNEFRPYDPAPLIEIVEIFERAGLQRMRDVVCSLGNQTAVPRPVQCEKDGEGLYVFNSATGRCESVFKMGNTTRECTIPSMTITRAQFAYIIVTALFGDNFSYTTTPFYEDVPPSHPYFKYIQKARDAGLMFGVQVNGKPFFWPDFTSPESYIFRGSVYIVAWRYRNKKVAPDPGTYSMTPYFPNVTPSTYPEHFPYIQSAYEQGLIVGISPGNEFKVFEPAPLTEIVEILERAGIQNVRDVICRSGSHTFLYYRVAYLYNTILNRPPDGRGFSYWTTADPCFSKMYSVYCLEWYIRAAIEALERTGYDAPCGIDLRTKPCHSIVDENNVPLSVKILASLFASSGTCPSVSTFDYYCNSRTIPVVNNLHVPFPPTSPASLSNRLCPIPAYLVEKHGANELISGKITNDYAFKIESDYRCSYTPRCDDGSAPRLVNGTYTCNEPMAYSSSILPMAYNWTSRDGVRNIKVRMKKGILIEGIVRAYGDGCFVRSRELSLCVTGGGTNLRFSFKHPEKGYQDLDVSLRRRWYNEFVAFVTPEMVALSVRDMGSERSEFRDIKLGYAPVDKDDPTREYTIDASLEPLRNDPFEIVVLTFYNTGRTKPFCPDGGFATCLSNKVVVNVQQEGRSITSGSSTVSSTNQCTPAMISVRFDRNGSGQGMVYSYRINGFIEENVYNIGDMFKYSTASPISAGICQYWKGPNDRAGFVQKLNENGLVEAYGFIFGSNAVPQRLGIYRVSNDYIGTVYFGTESNRRSNWLSYSIPPGFYEPTGATLRPPRSNEVLTDDGYFERYTNLCPSGQVELYQKTVYIPYGTETGTGKCYTYVEPADCYHSTMGGYDVDKIGNMCDLQVGVPDQCPPGTHLLTPRTSPSDDYKCEYRQAPGCPSWAIRIGGSCYEYLSPSVSYCQQNCGASCSSCSYIGNGLCECNTTYSTIRYATYLRGSITRAQFAVLYIRARYGDYFSYNTTPYFTDVPTSHSYFKYIQRLRQDGLTTGCSPSSYCPNDYLRRFELYIFLIRHILGDNFGYNTTPCYPDVTPSSVGETVFKYIQKACELNLVVGTQRGQNFYPLSHPSISEVNQAFSRAGLYLGYYVCPIVRGCALNYMDYYYYCYYTCSSRTTVSACPPTYSFDSSRGLCIRFYSGACPPNYTYDRNRDICYYRVDAQCSVGTRKCCDPEGGGYSGCYITNHYVGPGTAFPSDRIGKIYCRNGLHFYNDRCYRYEGIACSGTYSEGLVSSGNLVILGSEDSIGQWTGACWRKTEDSCRGDAIIRRPHVRGTQITDNTCGRERQRVDTLADLTSQSAISDFEQALLRYFGRYYFGTTSANFNVSPYPYTSSLIAFRGFFEESNKFVCPLDFNTPCAPLSGNTYVCAKSENHCAMCTEGIPPRANQNQAFVGIHRIKEYPDRVYGLFRSRYNYLGAYDIVNAIPGSRLPKNSEVPLIKSFFNIDSLWTEERVSAEKDFEKIDNVVIVMSPDNFGFVAECLFGDDMNMVCAADMVPCNGNTCPLGNYPCIPVNGVRYCSKYSWTCKNLADPRAWEGVEEWFDPDPETENPESIDMDEGCLGRLSIFPGTALRCRLSGPYTGFRDCCSDSLVEEKEIPKDNFGGTPNAFLYFGISMATTAITQAGQFMYRLYDIYRSGGTATLTVAAERVDPLLGKIKVYQLQYGDKSVLLSEGQGRMFEAIAGGGGSINIKDETGFGQALGKGLAAYFGSAEFAYDMFSAIVPMMINDPYGKAVANIALSALKMHLFPGTSPLGLAFAVASLVMTIFMMSCDAQDYQTVRLKKAGRCVKVGPFCVKSWPIVRCVQYGERYCCFNSKIARIIHEQGRPQLATFGYSHNWGSPRHPNCRGFSPEEFQALDFGKIDFSEYIEDLEREVKSKFRQVEQDIYRKMEETTKKRMPGGR
ncbi:MAG: S-layer homology domain-containing protein [Ignisphaera sp.]